MVSAQSICSTSLHRSCPQFHVSRAGDCLVSILMQQLPADVACDCGVLDPDAGQITNGDLVIVGPTFGDAAKDRSQFDRASSPIEDSVDVCLSALPEFYALTLEITNDQIGRLQHPTLEFLLSWRVGPDSSDVQSGVNSVSVNARSGHWRARDHCVAGRDHDVDVVDHRGWY